MEKEKGGGISIFLPFGILLETSCFQVSVRGCGAVIWGILGGGFRPPFFSGKNSHSLPKLVENSGNIYSQMRLSLISGDPATPHCLCPSTSPLKHVSSLRPWTKIPKCTQSAKTLQQPKQLKHVEILKLPTQADPTENSQRSQKWISNENLHFYFCFIIRWVSFHRTKKRRFFFVTRRIIDYVIKCAQLRFQNYESVLFLAHI